MNIQNGSKTATVQINNKCQLACTECYLEPSLVGNHLRRNAEITASQLEQMLEQMPTTETIFLAGAEVSLHPKKFHALAEVIINSGRNLRIVTNGAVSEDKFKNLLQYPDHTTRIALSIDSIDPTIHDEIRGLKGALNRTLKNLEIALDSGIPIKTQSTINPGNFHTTMETVDFLKDKKIPHIGIHSASLEAQKWTETRDHVDPIAWRSLLSVIRNKFSDVEIPIVFYTDDEFIEYLDLKGLDKKDYDNGSLGSQCLANPLEDQYIRPDGIVHACPIYSLSHPDHPHYLKINLENGTFTQDSSEYKLMQQEKTICPATPRSIKSKSDRIQSWIFENQQALIHACRYVSIPKSTIQLEDFTSFYASALDFYGKNFNKYFNKARGTSVINFEP